VNIPSVAGRKVRTTGGVYSGTKFAVGAISEGLRMGLQGDNIRVTAAEPGAVATGLPDHITDEETQHGMTHNLLGRGDTAAVAMDEAPG
jgi:NADP-dependent 3-hydroxy acid dehydrogenase YdfG